MFLLTDDDVLLLAKAPKPAHDSNCQNMRLN